MYLEATFRDVREASLRKKAYVRASVISDALGLGLQHIRNSKLMREVIAIGQQNYPELVQSVLVVRAPITMFAFWNYGISWFLPVRAKAKVEIVGTDFDAKLNKVNPPNYNFI